MGLSSGVLQGRSPGRPKWRPDRLSAKMPRRRILLPRPARSQSTSVNRAELLLEYPFAAPPPPGEVREVAPGVHWLRMPLPFALDHINLWALEDGAGLALVDTGVGNDATRALWQQVFDGFVKGRPVTRVIATHLHPDHAGNAGWLTTRFGAPLWMSQSDYLMAHAWSENTCGLLDRRDARAPAAPRPRGRAVRRAGEPRQRVPAQRARLSAHLPAHHRGRGARRSALGSGG